MSSSYSRSSKRQYTQSSLDSFLTRRTSSANPTHSQIVILPDDVQSNLLSVGMRVRKAIPEGYLHRKQTPLSASTQSLSKTSAPFSSISGNVRSSPSSMPSTTSTHRQELAPYCGINKIGGYGLPSSNDDYEDEFDFPSSQESVLSNASTSSANLGLQRLPNNIRKRGMLDEEEEEANGWNETFVMPQNVFSGLDALNKLTDESVKNRTIAHPKRKAIRASAPALTNDFEDVGFLQGDEEMDWAQ